VRGLFIKGVSGTTVQEFSFTLLIINVVYDENKGKD
jgi:hypothetical protein